MKADKTDKYASCETNYNWFNTHTLLQLLNTQKSKPANKTKLNNTEDYLEIVILIMLII